MPEVADQTAIIEALNHGGVKYVVIGQIAANLHGSAFFSFDLDICYERSPQNVRMLVEVLQGMHAYLRVGRTGGGEDLPFQLDERSILAGGTFTFETDHGPFDCLAWPAGVEGYEELAESAESYDLGGQAVLVASVDHLLIMRRKAGRRKDLDRVWELEEIKRIQESQE